MEKLDVAAGAERVATADASGGVEETVNAVATALGVL